MHDGKSVETRRIVTETTSNGSRIWFYSCNWYIVRDAYRKENPASTASFTLSPAMARSPLYPAMARSTLYKIN